MLAMVRASAVSVLPAVLVKGHDEALVLYAGHAGVVPVLAGEHLLLAVPGLPPDVGVLRPVEPQQGHHHLACNITIIIIIIIITAPLRHVNIEVACLDKP